MNQPDLGKKIAELRKAKGFTQEELVEKCNLNVRTLQRIESGEVSPRSYTIKTIFSALDYQIYDSLGSHKRFGEAGSTMYKWLEQFYPYLFDLFNLKTNTMKKISIITITIFTAVFLFITVGSESNAQTPDEVKRTIKMSNENFIRWFNAKQIDSLMTLFTDNACVVDVFCGRVLIEDFYQKMLQDDTKLKSLTSHSLTISDTIAVEKGRFVLISNIGEKTKREYQTEWRLRNNKWLIFRDISIIR